MAFLLNEQDLDKARIAHLQGQLKNLPSTMFIHPKMDSLVMKSIQDPYVLIGGMVSQEIKEIFNSCSFMFPYETRQLFFKLVSFIGSIDVNRSVFFLKQFLKSKGATLQEEKQLLKIQKQRATVDRKTLLGHAKKIMKQVNKRAFLEIQYEGEEGIGLGPTLEFYSLVSEEIRQLPIWRKMTDNSLFPAPINLREIGGDKLSDLYDNYRVAGAIVAKSIADDRLVDMPLSPLFWDILIGRKTNLFDLQRLDMDLFKTFVEL